MSMRVTLAVAATALMLGLAAPVAAFAADDTVVATVNGEKILKKDVMEAVKQLPVDQSKVKIEEVYPLVVDQIINEKLIEDKLAESKITESEDYKKRLEIIRVQLAKQMYLENAVKDKISDSAVKAEYKKFEKENKGKEEIRARHILVPTEEEAKQVIKELDGGAKFEDLANQRSSGPSAQNGGDLGYFTKEDMVPAFSTAAFGLKAGSYTKAPIKTDFGWHVIKVEDKRTRSVPKMEEVAGPIKNKLGQEALQKLVTDMRAEAKIERFDLDGKPVAAPKAPAAAE